MSLTLWGSERRPVPPSRLWKKARILDPVRVPGELKSLRRRVPDRLLLPQRLEDQLLHEDEGVAPPDAAGRARGEGLLEVAGIRQRRREVLVAPAVLVEWVTGAGNVCQVRRIGQDRPAGEAVAEDVEIDNRVGTGAAGRGQVTVDIRDRDAALGRCARPRPVERGEVVGEGDGGRAQLADTGEVEDVWLLPGDDSPRERNQAGAAARGLDPAVVGEVERAGRILDGRGRPVARVERDAFAGAFEEVEQGDPKRRIGAQGSSRHPKRELAPGAGRRGSQRPPVGRRTVGLVLGVIEAGDEEQLVRHPQARP